MKANVCLLISNTEQIFTKLGRRMGNGSGENPLHFGLNPGRGADLSFNFNIARLGIFLYFAGFSENNSWILIFRGDGVSKCGFIRGRIECCLVGNQVIIYHKPYVVTSVSLPTGLTPC